MANKPDDSRRRFMKRAVGTAAAPAVLAGAVSQAEAAAFNHRIAATVVRTSHSAVNHGMLRIGVRATVMAPELVAENVIFVVDPVAFAAPASETNRQIAESVQRQAAAWLNRRGVDVSEHDVAVQVFGVHA
jgi:hypothetical protein